MRKLVVIWVIFSGMVTMAQAQNTPVAEIFAGYSLDHAALQIQAPGQANASTTHGNFYGWNASLTVNPHSWLGVMFDVSGLYGRVSSFNTIELPPPCGPCTQPFNNIVHHMYTVALGPQLSFRRQKVTLFAHGMVGGAKTTEDVPSLDTFTPTRRQTDFSVAVIGGGGADIAMSQRFALRIQPDYLGTQLVSGRHNGFRLSTGIVVRLGEL
jgi:hypothetical protein